MSHAKPPSLFTFGSLREQQTNSEAEIWLASLNHTYMGGGVSQSVDTGARHPANALTNSNKQWDTEQTLTPNTPVRTSLFCRRAQNPNNQHAFSPRSAVGTPTNPSCWLKEKMTPSICLFGQTPQKTNRLGTEFEVGSSHIIYNSVSIGLTTQLCLRRALFHFDVWPEVTARRGQLHMLLLDFNLHFLQYESV